MKIKKFTAKAVHGYLDFNIDFNDKITFLIGINGSGKTSALKLILGLLSPSFNYLNEISFKTARIEGISETKKKSFVIEAKKTRSDKVKFSFYLGNNDPISDTFTLFSKSRFLELGYFKEELDEKIINYRDDFNSKNVVQEISKMSTPFFLGLDRRIYEGRKIDGHQNVWRNRSRQQSSNYDQSQMRTSLKDVIELLYDYHREIGAEQPKISEVFKTKILKSSFSFVKGQDANDIPLKVDSILEKKEKLQQAIQDLNVGDLHSEITTFFNNIESTLKNINQARSKKNKLGDIDYYSQVMSWFANSSQLKRIDDIIELSKKYQSEISKLRQPIKLFENIVNNFFSECNKSLVIMANGEMRIKLTNNKITRVFDLSSGEKQILIMIAHLIFYDQKEKPGIFIIDEPEVSLHLSWQEIFVNSIREASPNTQFILATHSPSIISCVENQKYCQDLSKTEL